jgi:cytochrome c-type biogenesis protein CcmE
MTALKPKHQRLVLLGVALVALIGAAILAAWALRNQASYFYVPSEIIRRRPIAPCAWAEWSRPVRSRPMPTA